MRAKKILGEIIGGIEAAIVGIFFLMITAIAVLIIGILGSGIYLSRFYLSRS